MQTVLTASSSRTLASAGAYPISCPSDPDIGPHLNESIDGLPASRGSSALLAAYRASGGTARGDDVARLLEDHGLSNYIGLARLISTHEVFGFEWRSSVWIPMFRFDLRDLSVRPSTKRVLAELGDGFDNWASAAWFAQPNSWLQHRKPIDLMNKDLHDVLSAARADRFIAVG